RRPVRAAADARAANPPGYLGQAGKPDLWVTFFRRYPSRASGLNRLGHVRSSGRRPRRSGFLAWLEKPVSGLLLAGCKVLRTHRSAQGPTHFFRRDFHVVQIAFYVWFVDCGDAVWAGGLRLVDGPG